ncbi:helix-turn-helix domain-containing protein [Eubacterium pyruvativorans]|uniref:helix-turn-helix domain-containing protein n=1 Tax=Eubacterium pyruvativorans TaxID=155865 RepID=UPI0023F09BA2|nr:helix-turn-helix transcriptional regulator [Eubacterium pyruvativorans]MCI5746287.1 helix-turn-helix transcriptional regulator [Eubacterium pyruvativorans]
MAIQVNLDKLLEKNGVTIRELSDAIGITPANLSVLKNNHARAIRFSTLESICRYLRCQPGELLSMTEERNGPGPSENESSQGDA